MTDNDQNIQNDAPNQGAQGQFHGDVNTGTQQDVSGERAVGIGGDSNAPVTTGNGNTVTNIGNQFNIAGDDPRKPRTWTRPDVLGLLTLLVTVIGVVGTYLALPWFPSSPPAPFVYDVNVENAATRDVISNAQVTLRVSGQPPLNTITDDNGYASLDVGSAYVGQTGELIIEADGFEQHTRNVQLEQKVLPNVVQLDPIAP